jgi:hypothetical protein
MGGLSSLTGGGGMSGGAGGASGPVSSTTSSGFNTSGWSVNYGSGSSAATAGGGLDWKVIAAIAVAGLVIWKMSK